MGERLEDPANAKRMKKMDKSQGNNNREYLDMDTDEEEFGRQETPEPEEELEGEPDKPVFTEEELNTLVQYVKDFTTISSLDESEWTLEVIEIVKEYFRNPANIVLTIFRESRTLKGRLDFPERTDEGLTYFLRSVWQIYTPENFPTSVIFGSVNDGIDNSTLKFMENMYAPIAFPNKEWPAVMRNEILSNLHKFLMCLTDATYKPMGITILYVPREGLEGDERCLSTLRKDSKKMENIIDIEENEAEDLIERLERVARYWIRQMREALNGACSLAKLSPCKTINDEILQWYYRYENLTCIYNQAMNKSVLSIVEQLESVRSASVEQYNPLLTQIRSRLDEAASNITYLKLLQDFNDGFEIPDGVEEYATNILLLIRFIGMESPFYRGEEKIETLCRAFCTQAVQHLQRYIDLSIILDGDASNGRDMVVKCIKCCEKLSNIYDNLADMDESSGTRVISLADKTKVFNHVNTFVQRCNDLTGITDARITFDKSDKPITIFGPKGIERGLHYQKIEELFHVTLNEIKNARDEILDVVSGNWLERMVTFKRGIKNVENMVKNWINDIFEDILNVEEGIEALYGIKRFSKRSHLRETSNEKWIQVWKIFGKELESCSNVTKNGSGILHHPSLPPYSGNAYIIRSNKIYLSRQYQMLIDASDWFGDCDVQAAITRKYKRVLAAMTKEEGDLFSQWQKYIMENEINPEMIMKKPILKYHNTEPDIIGINLDNYYLDNIREIDEWNILNYDTKNIFTKNCPKWQMLKSRYSRVEIVCKLYNRITQTISESERPLFATLLNDREEMLSLGFKMNWSSESFERFYTDCMEAMQKVQESYDTYRNIDWKINCMLKQIATTRLVNCDENFMATLEKSKTHFEKERRRGATMMGKKLETILILLSELKMRLNRLNIDDVQTTQCWNDYIMVTYEKLKKSFTDCIRLSLLSVLEFLLGDYTIEPPLLAESDVHSALFKEIQKEITGISSSLLEETFPVAAFRDVFESAGDMKLFIDCIEADKEIVDLRTKIDKHLMRK